MKKMKYIVVNGTPVSLNVSDHEPLSSFLCDVLNFAHATGNADNWNFRTEDGAVLNKSKSLSELGLSDKDVLFVSREAGIAAALMVQGEARRARELTDAAIDELADRFDLYGIQDGGRVDADTLRNFARALLSTQPGKYL